MQKWIIIAGAAFALALLGAGCRSTQPVVPANVSSAPSVTNTAPASDPLTDDLDAAIEDLNAIE